MAIVIIIMLSNNDSKSPNKIINDNSKRLPLFSATGFPGGSSVHDRCCGLLATSSFSFVSTPLGQYSA